MEGKYMRIKVRPTLYGWFAFKIYLPFLGSLGLYQLEGNMLCDIKNNISKYFVIKVFVTRQENEKKRYMTPENGGENGERR